MPDFSKLKINGVEYSVKDPVARAGGGGGGGNVLSVNGKTGAVVLDAEDVGALPDSYTPPAAPVQSVNGYDGAVVLTAQDVGALPDSYTPPAAPVQSVNGYDGAVVLTAQDVGALPDSYTPPAAPVQSVNGYTGAVSIDANDVGALTKGTLLWTNPDLTQVFSQQTVTLDLTNYNFIVIFFKQSNNNANFDELYTQICVVGASYWITGNYAGKFTRRRYTINTNGITFENSRLFDSYGADPQDGGSHLVPAKIYGL